jgi:hypothetical protein
MRMVPVLLAAAFLGKLNIFSGVSMQQYSFIKEASLQGCCARMV